MSRAGLHGASVAAAGPRKTGRDARGSWRRPGPGDVMTGPVFPEDSWVEVRYPLTSEQKHADRAAWPWLPGWVVARCGSDEWEICVQAPELATWHEGEAGTDLFPGLLRDPPARSTGRSGAACRA